MDGGSDRQTGKQAVDNIQLSHGILYELQSSIANLAIVLNKG
jgi:hypothetical protein